MHGNENDTYDSYERYEREGKCEFAGVDYVDGRY